MEEKELVKDYLRDRLQTEIDNSQFFVTSCTMSTIRWLQRYAHCYSIVCSFFCLPFWILVLPIAFVCDICIYTIALLVFIIAFIIYFLFAPCVLAYKFSSCTDAWNPVNIYRYSLSETLRCVLTTTSIFDVMWSCYCGSGEIEGGAPVCCCSFCCSPCRESCSEATHIQIRNQPCTIL